MFEEFSFPQLWRLPAADKTQLEPLFVSATLPPEGMLQAYRHGLFPWYGQNDPVLWWSPPTRCIIPVGAVHCSRSLKKLLRHKPYSLSVDHDFMAVMTHCATVHGETWIDDRMKRACHVLHQQGHAHSFELWNEGELIGGLYGIALDRVFCAESMFSLRPSASKMVLVALNQLLAQHKIEIIEVQFLTPHLASMGAREIPREMYFAYLLATRTRSPSSWRSAMPYSLTQFLLERL